MVHLTGRFWTLWRHAYIRMDEIECSECIYLVHSVGHAAAWGTSRCSYCQADSASKTRQTSDHVALPIALKVAESLA